MKNKKHYTDFLRPIVIEDVETLEKKDREYGGSWLKRGGIGAYMMACRKFDRLEEQVKRSGWDIIEAALKDGREEGVLDDIGDLRRYLLLIEAEIRSRMSFKESKPKTAKAGEANRKKPLKTQSRKK